NSGTQERCSGRGQPTRLVLSVGHLSLSNFFRVSYLTANLNPLAPHRDPLKPNSIPGVISGGALLRDLNRVLDRSYVAIPDILVGALRDLTLLVLYSLLRLLSRTRLGTNG